MTRRHAHTTCARSGVDQDTAHGAVMPPLYLSSNYSFAGFEQKRTYDYSRSGNPTRDVLAETLAELEGGRAASSPRPAWRRSICRCPCSNPATCWSPRTTAMAAPTAC
jgi:cystathionine beta-lyase/cystathionine gamma-synthase